jgi:FkbM family methyltransferase
MDCNGERFVLEAFRPYGLRGVFDVGANVGEWTQRAHECLPETTIHAFEIMEPTARVLRERTADLERVRVNAVGLADKEQTVSLRHFPEHSALAMLTDYPHPFAHVPATGRVIAGDGYVHEHGIERIDFLKIDVEGAEEPGAERVIGDFRPRSGANRPVRVRPGQRPDQVPALRFLPVLSSSWVQVGKTYPSYVEFRDYQFTDENFLGPNYLAVRAERTEILRALRGKA